LSESIKKRNVVILKELKKMDAKINIPISCQQVYELVRQLPVIEKQKLFTSLLKERIDRSGDNSIYTHFASEKSLAKDWLSPEEDEAWKNL
jgi:hypothetical protein